jgi:hypothetical protein
MGLSFHYHYTAPRGCTAAQAAALVRKIHAEARAWQKAGRVDRVLPIADEPEELNRWACAWHTMPHPDDPDTSTGVPISPEAGWIFPVIMGEGCEPVWFGLCRYPASIEHRGKKIATKLGDSWRFSHGTKTQYASLHGWDNFLRCHVGAIELINAWRAHGVRVKILDEGDYWPRRSVATLQRRLDQMNGLVAAFAGALKDAAGEDDDGRDDSESVVRGPIVAPILKHPQFERIEAEGAARFGEKIRAAARRIAREGRRDGKK